MQQIIKVTGRNSDCQMLSILFLFLLYFVHVVWTHFITVEYYSVTKVLIRRLELCCVIIIIIVSELCTGHFSPSNEGKVNVLLKHSVWVSVFFCHTVYCNFYSLYDVKTWVGEEGSVCCYRRKLEWIYLYMKKIITPCHRTASVWTL
jgi:hypothetical protein